LQSVKVQKEGVRQLPIAIEDTYIYQEAEMLTIESARGFSMQCNFKFDVCTFTLSGKFLFIYIYFIQLQTDELDVQWIGLVPTIRW
jgi:hypothetical protein